jgi:chromosomal replication initiation ATPase DnaA
MSENVWQGVLERLRTALDAEEFRRWFDGTSYAGDSGDQITVWVHSESVRRHILVHYQALILRALKALNRPNADVRFVVSGYGEDEEE